MNDEWDKGINLISQNESFNLVKISFITCLNELGYSIGSLLNYAGFPT
jgi:hypothetical protein